MDLAWIEIDLAALRRNARRIAERAHPSEVWAVVKADAYGHGMLEVARTLSQEGVQGFAVARTSEALNLRDSGVRERILLLGEIDAHDLPYLQEREVEVVAYSLDTLDVLLGYDPGDAASSLRVHLKVDTGLHRLGLAPHTLPRALSLLHDAEHLRLAGLLSHLQESEEVAGQATSDQLQAFEEACRLAGQTVPSRANLEAHVANSAAALYEPAARYDAVRVGGAFYGLELTNVEQAKQSVRPPAEVEPVMRVVSRIALLRWLEPGEAVGYNARFKTERETLIAVVPVGYADGYTSHSAKGAASREVLVRGRRCPIVGAISMDRITVDVTAADCSLGDEVVLLGRQGASQITASELAERSGDSLYEVTCRFALRLPRSVEDGISPGDPLEGL